MALFPTCLGSVWTLGVARDIGRWFTARPRGSDNILSISFNPLLAIHGHSLAQQNFEFCYFIVNRTMGPNGLLFHFPLSPSPTPQTCTPNPNRDNPTMTNMVDRRWYELNKHIFPESVWTEFDPNTDYSNMVRRDMGGNAYLFKLNQLLSSQLWLLPG